MNLFHYYGEEGQAHMEKSSSFTDNFNDVHVGRGQTYFLRRWTYRVSFLYSTDALCSCHVL